MPSRGEALDALEDRVAALRVDADGRLVEDEQPRAVQQADADVEPPLHAARVGLGLVVGAVGQADHVEHLVDARAGLAPRSPYRRPKKRRFSRAVRSG